jgi:hypothetical protein
VIDAAFARRPIGIILALWLLDAYREQDFERGVGSGAHKRRKGPGIEAGFLKLGIDTRARSVRPGVANMPE